ncbi:MAG: hypothetical protein ABL908_04195 [Hyphomicrobium sp.]
MVLVWVSPVLLFLALMASGRIKAPPASLVATLASGLVAATAAPIPVSGADLARHFGAGLWIALPATMVILAGLFFARATERLAAADDAGPISHDTLATRCLIIGPFIETATGFGVGYVVALSGVARAGVGHSQALALAAFSQFLVPWGALGIGTRISSEISGVPLTALGWRLALITALWSIVLLPLFWRLSEAAGVPPTRRDRVVWALTFAALMPLLLAANSVFTVEIAGLAALAPVLVGRHLAARGRSGLSRDALEVALPYACLILALAAMRFVSPFASLLEAWSFRPYPELARFAPLASPALPLVMIGLGMAARRGGISAVRRAGQQMMVGGWRAATLTFLLVGMAAVMVRSGLSAAVMGEITRAAGNLSPIALPVVGAVGGYLTGSNAGAGALSMPLLAGLSPDPAHAAWIAAAAIFTGSAMTALSPVRVTMGTGLIGASPAEGRRAIIGLLSFALSAWGVATLVALAPLLLDLR